MLGYAGLIEARSLPSVACCLLLIGSGYGVNSMTVTTLASYTAQRSRNAFPIYAMMQTGVNLAAALAPMLANRLRLTVAPEAVFALSLLLLAASVGLSLRMRQDVPRLYQEMRMWKAALSLLRTPRYWTAFAAVAGGWAIYVQKFAATPLFLARVLQRPEYVGFVPAGIAVIGLFAVLPVSSFIRYHALKSRDVLACCFLLYAGGYGVIALLPTLAGVCVGTLFWGLAEAALMPQLNTLIAEYTGAAYRLAGFSLAAAAIGIGEAAGSAAGVGLVSVHGADCYYVFALASLLAAGLARFLPLTLPSSETPPG